MKWRCLVSLSRPLRRDTFSTRSLTDRCLPPFRPLGHDTRCSLQVEKACSERPNIIMTAKGACGGDRPRQDRPRFLPSPRHQSPSTPTRFWRARGQTGVSKPLPSAPPHSRAIAGGGWQKVSARGSSPSPSDRRFHGDLLP